MGHKQRLRAGRSEALPLDDDQDADQGTGIEIEVVDRPVEPVSTSPVVEDSGDDPLEVLKKQFDEVKSAREASDRRALELEKANREHQAELARKSASEIGGQKAVLEQTYNAEELKLANVKREYADHLRQGRFDEAADAQIEISRSMAYMGQLANAYQGLEVQEKAPKAQPSPQQVADPFETAVSKMEPRVAAWAREHKDDVLKPDRQKLAYAADQMAIAKGFKPGSDEYLDYLDDAMGYELADDPVPAKQAAQIPAKASSKRMPAAPPSRRSASAPGRRQVFLTEDDKRQADGYGVSHQEYAKWKHDAESSGSLDGGMHERLHYKAVSR